MSVTAAAKNYADALTRLPAAALPEPLAALWLEQAEAPVEPEPEPPRPTGRPTLKVIK